MRARELPLEALRTLHECEWRDRSRGIFVAHGRAFVPVREGHPHDLVLPERREGKRRRFQRLGEMLVIHGPRPGMEELRELIARFSPRGIVWIRRVSGITRAPEAEILHGTCGEVCVAEHGCRYFLDPSRVMFAQGNLHERHRIAELVRREGRSERIADMCAGIGYFSIPVALAGAHVHAMEISPAAHAYLLRNVEENGVRDRVEVSLGDCRELLRGVYDRFMIGHFESLRFLPHALRHARAGSVLHLHTIGDACTAIREATGRAGFSAQIACRRVKKYAPHRWHLAWDVILS